MIERVLPDTNVLGEVWNPQGLARVRGALAAVAERVVLSAIVLGEIYRGIRQLTPSHRRSRLAAFYDGLVRDYGDEILPVTRPVAELWGDLTVSVRARGRVLHPADGLIAATALHHDATLWTRNTGDFEGTGVRLFNPWED